MRITDARLKTVWGGVAYEQLLVRPPSISVEAPFDGNFTGGSRTSVDEIELLMPPEFDWLARLDWPETSIRLRLAEDGAADGTLLDYGRFVIARISADERAVRLICKDWQAELTRPFLPQYDGSGGLGGEAADTGQYIPIGWGRLRQAPARFINRAQLVMRFDRGPVGAVQAVRQRGLLIPIEADHADLAALTAAVITPGQCRTCSALGLVRFRFAPGEPVTVDYLGSSQGGYVETLPSIAGRVAAAAGLSVNAAALASLSAALTQPGGYLASDAATPAQAFDQLLAGVRAVWAIDWNAELTFGRIGFDDPVDIDEVLSVEVSAGRPPSYEHKLGWGRNWRPLADGEVAEGITAADVAGLGALATQDGVDWDSQVGGDGKPQDNATVGAPAGTLVGSIPAEWLHLGATNDIIHEDFTTYTDVSEIEPDVWLRRAGAGEIGLGNSALFSGGRGLQCGNNSGDDLSWIVCGRSIPYDPDAVYLVTATVFRQSGNGAVYIGVEGRALDDINLVNRSGLNEVGDQHYFAANGVVPPLGQLVTYTGYLKGYSATPSYSGDIAAPGTVHPDVRRIAPLAILNYGGVSGITYLGSFTLQRLTDGYAETVVQAAEATDRLIRIGSDSLIAQEEKASFVREINALLTLADQTIIAANNVGLGAGNPAANWASAVTVRRDSLSALLASYTTPSLWSDTTGDTNVNAVNLEYAIADLNSYIAQAQAAISTRASTTANWSGVNNDTGGKPEDYATNDRGADTQNDNFSPNYYRQFFLLRERTEFKITSVIGAPGSSAYGTLYTYASWSDDSGGPVIQRFESSSGTYWRRGTNASSWGAWAKSFDELNRPDFATNDILSGGVALRPGDVRNNAIVLSSDGTLSFNTGFGFVNLGAISISQVPGKITGTQIENNAITTPLLAANVVTGDKLAANSIITLSAQIAVGVIQAANISSLSASVINAGLLDARRLSLDGATIEPDASGVLRVRNAGVGTDQLAAGALVQPVSINAIGTQNLTQNGWATAYLSGSFVQLTVNNAAAYPGIVKLDVTAYLYQSGSESDEVTMRVYYSGANVGSVGPMDVSGGSTRLNSIPATFTDPIPANTTRTYFIEFYSNDQTVLRQITASAQLFKRT